MKALIQRVSCSSVTTPNASATAIGPGFNVLLGVFDTDSESDCSYLAGKTANLRVFPDSQGRMNCSIMETGGEILVISQFTLCADTKKGNRPSFIDAAAPGKAEALYEKYVELLRERVGKDKVKTGTFRAHMTVEIINNGPVTIELDSKTVASHMARGG